MDAEGKCADKVLVDATLKLLSACGSAVGEEETIDPMASRAKVEAQVRLRCSSGIFKD